MHESLPKGDLTPLLGPVPVYVPPTQAEIDSGLLPQLPMLLEDGQPPTYHMIVVSGQETPTPSGIPLGLAAVKWGAGHSHTSTPSIATHATSPFAVAAGGQQQAAQTSTLQKQQQQVSSQALSTPARTAAAPHPSPLGGTQAKASADVSGSGGLQPPAFSLSPASPPPTALSPLSSAAATPSPAPSSATPTPLTMATSGATNAKSNLSLQIPGNGPNGGASSGGSSSATSKTGSPTSGRTTAAGSSDHSASDVGLPELVEPKGGPSTSIASMDGSSDGIRPDAAQVAGGNKASQPRMSEPKGWSELLEDWFCNRAGEPLPHRTVAPTPTPTAPGSADVSDAEEEGASLAVPSEPAVQSASRSFKAARVVEEGLGAYQLVRKERMLGIYLAVFVWKGASHLLEATSGSYVTTGLIGGRWGNKGGVAISLKLAGKRLLFINSHLSGLLPESIWVFSLV